MLKWQPCNGKNLCLLGKNWDPELDSDGYNQIEVINIYHSDMHKIMKRNQSTHIRNTDHSTVLIKQEPAVTELKWQNPAPLPPVAGQGVR